MTRISLTIYLAAMLMIITAEARANGPAPHTVVPKRMDISVHQLAPIAFGTFASTGNGGSIVIDAGSGARSISGAINVLNSGDYGQAEFTISGQPGQEILVSPPASTALSQTGTGGDMVITDFKVSPAEIVTLDRQGNAKIKIGGTLKVPGGVPQGAYNGFFNVTARYMH